MLNGQQKLDNPKQEEIQMRHRMVTQWTAAPPRPAENLELKERELRMNNQWNSASRRLDMLY